VQVLIGAALEKQGITSELIFAGLKDGLPAEEVKLTTRDGKFSDERRIPDWHARAKFQEMTHRLRGDWPKEQQVQQAALIIKLPSDANLFAETLSTMNQGR